MKIVIVLLAFLLVSCSLAPISGRSPTGTFPPSAPTHQPTKMVLPSTLTQLVGAPLPPVEGPEPSYKVAAFYYPWYGNPAVDGQWIHWEQAGYQPPKSISSDYYPTLGAYSSRDPAVVAQHMAWLRQAGIGVIIASWWGSGSNEDNAVPLILKMAERYGIKVAFHIEPYQGRTADGLVSDIKYINQKYGNSPAFFLSTASTPYSPGTQPKGMFFVWCTLFAGQGQCGNQPVQADYWQKALDEIHALPQGGLVIADRLQPGWINDGHFDGLYNYITLNLDEEGGFGWAQSLPMGALYIPSVMPGNSARRVGYPESTYVARLDGQTFSEQWTAALGTGVQPEMMTITSFNEWHEGSMIEPPAVGASDGKGYTYANFGSLPPDGYLTLTRDWITKYLGTTWPSGYRARIEITTTSDWTTLNIVRGGAWIRPERISASDSVTAARMEVDNRFLLMQSLADAKAGNQVQMIWDVMLMDLIPGGVLTLQIERGNLGVTQVTIYNDTGTVPKKIKTFKWGGITTDRNSLTVQIPSADLFTTFP
jgi:glycoprotein endo-alpha-1,2-mannosidase